MFQPVSDDKVNWVYVADWGKLGYQEFAGNAIVHCVIYQITIDRFRTFDEYMRKFKSYVKAQGFSCMFSIIAEADIKNIKFHRRFGMVEVIRENGIVLFRQEL